MWSQIIPVVGTLGGAVVTGLVALTAGYIRARADRDISRQQMEAQRVLVQEQHKSQLEIEREKQKREKIDESYGRLMVWLRYLERSIEDIWMSLHEDADSNLRERADELLKNWPFEVLKPGDDAAAGEYYWSEEVVELLREFSGRSSRFVPAAGTVRQMMNSSIDNDDEVIRKSIRERKERVFLARIDLISVLGRVRQAVRVEMRGR